MGFHSRASKSQVRRREARGDIDSLLENIIETRDRADELVATILIQTAGFDLDQTLCVVAHAAAELVDARYAGLEVYRPDDRIEASLYRDIRYEDTHDAIRVEIRSILGSYPGPSPVVDQPTTTRANRSVVHLAPVGRTVLEVPIRVRDWVFGNLSVTDKADDGHFSDDDEAVIVVFAAAAGFAIENALRVEQARIRQEWTREAGAIATELLADIDIGSALRLIADTATSLTGIGHCLLVVPRDPDTPVPEAAELVVVDSIGSRSEEVDGVLAVVDAAVRMVFIDGAPLRLPAHDIEQISTLPVPPGPVLALPLPGIDRPLGVMVNLRPAGAPPFSDDECEVIAAFADRVATALRLVMARVQLEVEDREARQRIASDVERQMMQRLFAVRASLHDALPHTEGPEVARLWGAIDELAYVAQRVWPAIVDGRPIDRADSGLIREHDGSIAVAARDVGQRTLPTPVAAASAVVSMLLEPGDSASGARAAASATG